MPKLTVILAAFFAVLCSQNSHAITLTAGQEDFTTSADITENSSGIISSLDGTDGDLNSITNLHSITTGNNGATSSGYGIKVSGEFNQITNATDAEINTTGSSGRGISIKGGSSVAINNGSISTLGSSSYGIYIGKDNNDATNSGTIETVQSYGIYLDGNFNQFTNSGTITTTAGTSAYGIYISAGSDLAATETDYNEVENSGNINSNDHGIYNKDEFTHITNSGTITPLNDTSIYGINNEGDDAVITNSGTVNSARYAIYNNGEDVTINNSGTLAGDLRLGNSTLNILGGSITGIIVGNDAARIEVGSGVTYTQENDFEDISTLTVNANAAFNVNSVIEAQTIFVANDGNLNLNSGADLTVTTIRGLTNGVGNVNLSAIDFSGDLGISGSALENINIASNASFIAAGDIFSSNVSASGLLNFSASDNSTLHGSLTINDGGALNIASQNQIISGNFTLAENGILASSLNNNILGNLQITGDATVADGAKLSLNIATNDYIENGARFTILSADGSANISEISTADISVNDSSSNIYGLLRFTTISDGGALYLESNHLAASEISSNQNTQNIYSALGEIGGSSGGKLREFQSYLDSANLASDALDLAINQVAPFPTKANILITTNIVNNAIKIDEKRLDKSRFNENLNHGFWVEAFGNNLNQNQVKNDDGFSANSVGVVFGLDKETAKGNISGVSLSYARSTVKTLDDSKSNLISTYQLSAFGGLKFNKYFIDLIGSFALHQYSQTKAIDAIEAGSTARYNGQTYAAKIKFGKIENLKYDLKFIPEFSLNLMHSAIDGYTENGADTLNLQVGGVAANYLEARAGAAIGWVTRIPDLNEFKKFVLLARASLGQNIINDTPTTSANFSENTQSFDQRISQLDATSIKLGFEIDAYHMDDIAFGFEYALEKRSSLQSHFVMMKVRQAF
jgi:uncharacterized protein with beta-barrel porin domain